jgi:hypothetical protein
MTIENLCASINTTRNARSAETSRPHSLGQLARHKLVPTFERNIWPVSS